MNLSKRLLTISELVNDQGSIMDIGCDHALLDIYLAKTKPKLSIIASDNKLGPMSKAKENVIRERVNIEVKLCDGLDGIGTGTDTVIISGMGGKNIVDIFKRGKNKIGNVNTIILSPHSDFFSVRKYINRLGFYIDKEQLLKEKNKTYLIVRFKRGKVKYTKEELFFGPVLLKEKSETFVKKWTNHRHYLLGVMNNINDKECYNYKLLEHMVSLINKVI